MFRRITGSVQATAENLFQYHPARIEAILERCWGLRPTGGGTLGTPANRSNLRRLSLGFVNMFPPMPLLPAGPLLWHHLMYAYLLESTGMYDVFRKLVLELIHGEKLGVISPASQRWLRNTEELFFRSNSFFYISSLNSDLRPDSKAIRCNAYYRLLGMELPQNTSPNTPYPYIKPETANRTFLTTFEEFLQEVWIGIINENNATGANPTDRVRIANLAQTMQEMLLDRRESGNLSREEFWAVTTLSWFHLTLEFNVPIITDLKAEATSPSLRLSTLAERVGMRVHPKSEAMFRMADEISTILIGIENGLFNNIPGVNSLITTGLPFNTDILQIISNWSQATGREIKGPHTKTKLIG